MDLLLFSSLDGSKADGGPLPVRFAFIWLGKLMCNGAAADNEEEGCTIEWLSVGAWLVLATAVVLVVGMGPR